MMTGDTPILVVDDDRKLCELLRDYLVRFSFQVEYENRPTLALKKIAANDYAAAVFDIMMPEMDGFELLRRLRQQKNPLPVIMLTARGEVTDKVLGLESGADDYLAKPFEPRELAARLSAVIRRQRGRSHDDKPLNFAELRIDPARQQASVLNGKQWRDARLTDGEYRALMALVAARPAVVSRDELSAQLRGISFDIADRSLDITISRLRAKLGESPKAPRFIKTSRYSGYAFIAAEAKK